MIHQAAFTAVKALLLNPFYVSHKNTQEDDAHAEFIKQSSSIPVLHQKDQTFKMDRVDLNKTGQLSGPAVEKKNSLIYSSSERTYGKLIFISIKVVQI